MKALKWIAGAVVLLLISLVVYLTMFFNLNDFKPEIIDAVKKKTHRDFVITQDLSWKFFPRLGIKLGGVALSNPEGFEPKQMLQVEQAVVEVALLPLFSKKLEVAALKFDGVTVNLVTQKNGRNSLDGLASATKTPAKDKTPSSELPGIAGLKIGGISITRSQINLIDEMKGERKQFTLDKLALGRLTPDQFTKLDFKASATLPDMTLASEGRGELMVTGGLQSIKVKDLKIENTIEGKSIPNKKMQINLTSQVDLSLVEKQLKLQLDALSADTLKATGNVNVHYGSDVPMITAKIDVGDVDVDALLPRQKGEKASAGVPGAKSADKSADKQTEPDLTGLKKVDLKLMMTVKSIKAANLHTQNWLMEMNLKNGVLDLKNLTAQLYQGKMKASGQLDARQKVASYRFSKNVEAVQIRPLLKDVANVDLLSGTANFNASGSGQSLIVENLKKNLLAKGNFNVTNGAVHGVNIPQMIRTAQSALKGEFKQESAPEQKTDFTSLTGSFSVANGVATNPDLLMASPLIRLSGAGNANLISQALNYKLTARLVGSLKGQGTEKDKLSSVDIPLTITGTMQKPKYGLDTTGLLDTKLKQEKEKVKEKLKSKLLKELRF